MATDTLFRGEICCDDEALQLKPKTSVPGRDKLIDVLAAMIKSRKQKQPAYSDIEMKLKLGVSTILNTYRGNQWTPPSLHKVNLAMISADSRDQRMKSRGMSPA